MRRILILAMVGLICMSSAALSETPDYLNLDSTLPVVKDGQTLTLSIAVMPNRDDNVENLWFWEFCRQKMNIDFEITAFTGIVRDEKVNLMFASDSLPDILTGVNLSVSELVLYGQTEGQLLALNDYIEPYAPNVAAIFEANPEYRGEVTSLDGLIYSLPCINPPLNILGITPTVFIRTAKLAELGLEKPKTLDSFYEALAAFKAENPENIPLGGGAAAMNPAQIVYTALGFTADDAVSPGFLQKEEVVVLAGHPLYEQYLRYMNKLYTEGLMSKDFYTLDAVQVRGKASEGLLLVLPEPPYNSLPETWKEWESIEPLTSEWNDQQLWQGAKLAKPGAAVISSKSKHPEACMRFLDYFFTLEGGIYAWNGPLVGSEDTLGMVCGWYGNEKVPDVESGVFPSAWEYVVSKVSPFNPNRVGTKGGEIERLIFQDPNAVFAWDLENGEQFYRASKEASVAPYFVDAYPTIYFDEATNQRINELKLVISDYVANETAKYITGVSSLDNIATYFAQLEALGFAEYQQYYIDAYEVYRSNLQ